MSKKILLIKAVSIAILVICILLSTKVNAQYGFGTNQPSDSSVIHIVSPDSSQGVILPFVTNLSRPGAANNIKGMLVYNLTDSAIQYCDGLQWVTLNPDSLWDHDFYEVGTTNPPDAITDNIYTQGNVGIGTTNPISKLHIEEGDIKLTDPDVSTNNLAQTDQYGSIGIADNARGGLRIRGYHEGAYDLNNNPLVLEGFTSDNNTGNPAMVTFSGGRYLADGTIADLGGTSRTYFRWITAGTETTLMFINGGKMLGIGEISNGNLDAKVHIRSDNSSLGNYAVKVENSNTDPLFTVANNNRTGIGTSSPSAKFHIHNDVSGADSAFVVTAAGNVGIGTTNPSGSFHLINNSDNPSIIESYDAGLGGQLNPILNVLGDDNTLIMQLNDRDLAPVASFYARNPSLASNPSFLFRSNSSYNNEAIVKISNTVHTNVPNYLDLHATQNINHNGYWIKATQGTTPTNMFYVKHDGSGYFKGTLTVDSMAIDNSLDSILVTTNAGLIKKRSIQSISDSIVLAENGLQVVNNKVVLGNNDATSGPADITSNRYLNLNGNNLYINGSVNTDTSVAAFFDNGDVLFGNDKTNENFISRFFWDKSKGSVYFGHDLNVQGNLNSLGNSNLVFGYASGGGDYSIVGGFNFRDTGDYSVSLGSSALGRTSNYSFVSGHILKGTFSSSTANGYFYNDGTVSFSTIQGSLGRVVSTLSYSHITALYGDLDNVNSTFGNVAWSPYVDIPGNEHAYLRNVSGSFINVSSSDTIEDMSRSIMVGNRIKSDGANRSFILGNNIENTGSEVFIYNAITNPNPTTSTTPYTITNSTSKRFLAGFTNGFDFATALSSGDISNGMRLKSDNTLQLMDYGDTSHTGTIATILASDDEGNVIETTLSSLGTTLNDNDWTLDADTLYSGPDSTVVIKGSNVGIGSINPQASLDVEGQAHISNTVQLTNNNAQGTLISAPNIPIPWNIGYDGLSGFTFKGGGTGGNSVLTISGDNAGGSILRFTEAASGGSMRIKGTLPTAFPAAINYLGIEWDGNGKPFQFYNTSTATEIHFTEDSDIDLVDGNVRIRNIADSTLDEIAVFAPSGYMYKRSLDDIADSISSQIQDHDFYEVGTTNPPDTITDNIYTQGNVGIGTTNPNIGSHRILYLNGNSGTGATGLIINTDATNRHAYLDFRDQGNIAARIEYAQGGNYDLSFSTGGLNERMRIKSSGHIGIGTTSPDTTLHIEGSLKIVDGNEANGYVLQSDANGVGTWVDPSSITAADDGDWTLDADTLYSGPDSTVVIKGGNIGIGTTNPIRKLTLSSGDIQLDNNQGIYFKRSTQPNDPRIFYTSSNNFQIFNPVDGYIQFSTNSAEVAQFNSTGLRFNTSRGIYTASASDSLWILGNSGLSLEASEGGSGRGNISFYQKGIEVATIDTSGLIGMGTNKPSNKLHITSASDPIKVEGLQNDATMDTLVTIDSNGVLHKRGLADVADSISSQIQDHDFYKVGTTSSPDAITDHIYTQGNVGIGTTDPETKLDVNGQLTVGDRIITREDGNRNTYIDFDTDFVEIRAAGAPFVTAVGNVAQRELVINQNAGDMDFRVESDNNSYALFMEASTGNVGIGTTAPPSSKLSIIGQGNDTSTEAFMIENSDNEKLFQVNDQGQITIGDIAPIASYHFSMQPISGSANILRVNTSSGNQVLNINATGQVVYSGPDFTQTSGAYDNFRISRTIAPTSGSTDFSLFKVTPTINQTGSANGDIIGIHYNPTLTNVQGNHYAAIFEEGNIGIGTATPSAILDVRATSTAVGNIKAEGITSQSGPLLYLKQGPSASQLLIDGENSSGTDVFTVSNTGIVTLNGGATLRGSSGDLLLSAAGNQSIDVQLNGVAEDFTVSNGGANTYLSVKRDAGGFVGVGINTASPDTSLHIEGNLKMVDGNEANGYVMVSDANGVGSWQSPAAVNATSTNISADYSATSNDEIIFVDASANDVTVILPTAASNNGKKLYVKRVDNASGGFMLTIDGNATETIDGAPTQATVGVAYGGWTVASNGTNWFVIGRF